MSHFDQHNEPRIRHMLREDLHSGDLRRTLRRDWQELKEFFLDEKRRERLQANRVACSCSSLKTRCWRKQSCGVPDMPVQVALLPESSPQLRGWDCLALLQAGQ